MCAIKFNIKKIHGPMTQIRLGTISIKTGMPSWTFSQDQSLNKIKGLLEGSIST